MEDRPNYYAVIPATIRYDKDLTANEKLLYGEITALTNKNGECYATNKYFAELYNVEIPSVSRWIRHLKEKNYISNEIIYKAGSKEVEKRVILINGEPINKKVKTYSQNCYEGINKNVKENNITTTNNSQKNIYDVIQENFGRTIAPIEFEKIQSWEEYNFPFDLLKYAVSKAVLNGVYTINYIDKILYEWNKNNIKTVLQAQIADKDYDDSKNQSKSKKERNTQLAQQKKNTSIVYKEL